MLRKILLSTAWENTPLVSDWLPPLYHVRSRRRAKGRADMIFVRRRHRVGLCCQHRLICSARPPLSFRILYTVPGFIIVAAFLRAHTHTHIRSFHREIYFSFYFFPTHPLAIVSIHLYSRSHPHHPLRHDPYIDVHNWAAVSISLAGARKTRRSPAEWRRHRPQQWVVFSTVYIFIKENFYGSTVIPSTRTSTNRQTDDIYYHSVELMHKTIILSCTRVLYSLSVVGPSCQEWRTSFKPFTSPTRPYPFKQSRTQPHWHSSSSALVNRPFKGVKQ